MAAFLEWFEAPNEYDGVLKAALAHLWFVTIHPFDDGNGRIARAIADMSLARSEICPQRFYSMSAQTRKERLAYYDVLEATQKGGMNVTQWMVWFLECLDRAIQRAESILNCVLSKARMWEKFSAIQMNERQRNIVNRLIDGFDGYLTTQKWAKIGKCSHDTALRDIQDLMDKKVLISDQPRGRTSSYALVSIP